MERGGPSAPQIPARPTIFQYADSLPFFHGRLTNTEQNLDYKWVHQENQSTKNSGGIAISKFDVGSLYAATETKFKLRTHEFIADLSKVAVYQGKDNCIICKEDRIFKYYLDRRGAFLLRKSNSQPDTLVISIVVDRKNIFHIKVEQKHGKVCILQSNEVFPSLAHLLEYFHRHPFPATKHKELYLTKAIYANKFSPTPTIGGRDPPIPSEQKRSSIDERPPMPLPPSQNPSQNPIYAEYRHLYSRVEKVESDQLNLILRLCEEVDKEIQNVSRMKCSCGLYMEESELIEGWMMHRDTEGEATRGRIFFLDTQTNQSTWKLPSHIEMEIKRNYPEKWKLLCRLMKEPIANYDF